MKALTIFFLTLVLYSFSSQKSGFTLDKSDYVVLRNKDWHGNFKDVKHARLSVNEFIQIEEIIDIAIQQNNDLQKKSIEENNKIKGNKKWNETGFELRKKGFKRQYIPIINSNGEKVIWVNFFCDDFGTTKWKKELFTVFDGGNCFYNLKVNLTTRTYSELEINGDA